MVATTLFVLGSMRRRLPSTKLWTQTAVLVTAIEYWSLGSSRAIFALIVPMGRTDGVTDVDLPVPGLQAARTSTQSRVTLHCKVRGLRCLRHIKISPPLFSEIEA